MRTKGLKATALSLILTLTLIICPIIAVSVSADDEVTVSFTVSPEIEVVPSFKIPFFK